LNKQDKSVLKSKKLVKFTKDKMPLLEIVGDPKVCVVSWTGRKATEVYTKMVEMHWEISYIALPMGFHIAITAGNLPNLQNNKFSNDLKDAYDFVANNPQFKPSETCKMYGMSSGVPQEFAKNNLDILVDNMIE